MLPLLDDDHPFIRYLAVETLSGMGQGAKQALLPLKQRRDSDPIIQAAITDAVAAIESGQTPTPALPQEVGTNDPHRAGENVSPRVPTRLDSGSLF